MKAKTTEGRRAHALAAPLVAMWLILCSALAVHAQDQMPENPPPDTLRLYVPGAPGGGFDRTAEAMRDALLEAGLVARVELRHSPGAGGLIGLSEFLRSETGKADAVFVAGRSTVGATDFNRSAVSLRNTEPVAAMLSTSIAIAVPRDSPIRSLESLLGAFRDDPDALKWVGGSAGSQDELMLFEVADALGVDRRAIHYRPVPGGGASVIGVSLAGQADVVLSSPEELSDALRDGRLRLLATSQQVRGLNSPVLADVGIRDVSRDWRGVFAAPGLSAAELSALESVFARLAMSASWQERLASRGWDDFYLPREDFRRFLETESRDVRALRASEPDMSSPNADLARVVGRPYRWLPLMGVLIAALAGAVLWQRVGGRRRTATLEADLESLKTEVDRRLSGARDHIEREFNGWRLTASEREVGWLLLKGLSFREVSAARGTSERTARQQARAVYAKSGLGSRSDLSAYFFEDLVFGDVGQAAHPAP